jgi:hypothetical protein
VKGQRTLCLSASNPPRHGGRAGAGFINKSERQFVTDHDSNPAIGEPLMERPAVLTLAPSALTTGTDPDPASIDPADAARIVQDPTPLGELRGKVRFFAGSRAKAERANAERTADAIAPSLNTSARGSQGCADLSHERGSAAQS